MHTAHSTFNPTFETADYGPARVVPSIARPVHERPSHGADHGDHRPLGFYPLGEAPPWLMPRSSRWGDAGKVGTLVVLGALTIFIIRMLIAE